MSAPTAMFALTVIWGLSAAFAAIAGESCDFELLMSGLFWIGGSICERLDRRPA